MRRVIVESPYGNADPQVVAENERYARACLHDCLIRGESPYASHLLLTQEGVLNDQDPDERELGMSAGWAWREVADVVVVYLDRGVSSGMQRAIKDAIAEGRMIERRWLYRKNWSQP